MELKHCQQLPQASPLLVPSFRLRLLIRSCYNVAFLTYAQGTTECSYLYSECIGLVRTFYLTPVGLIESSSSLAVEGQNGL